MATKKAITAEALTAANDSIDRQDWVSQRLGKAEGLVRLVQCQFGGAVPQGATFRYRREVVERVREYLEEVEDEVGDVCAEADGILMGARAVAEVLVSDFRSMDAPRLGDEVADWCLWSLADDIKRAKACVDA